MTTSHWLKQHTFSSPDISTDVVIIGGGYAGLSAAYWISEFRPDLKITILERGICGSSASGRNAGFLTKGSASFYQALSQKWGKQSALEIFNFANESIEMVHDRILKSSPEIKFERSSSLTLFETEACHNKWRIDQEALSDFRFKWLKNSDLPAVVNKQFFGAYESASEYKINPVQLMGSLKKQLESRKVQIIEKVSAFDINSYGVSTEIHKIKAKQIVLALNGYFPEFHSAFTGIIHPYRAQMLAVEMEENVDLPSLYYDPLERVYWRKISQKVLVIGGKRLLDPEGEQGTFDKISPVIQKGLENYLSGKLGLKFKVINRWSGIMGFTETELPYITEIQAPAKTYMLGGFSGHGIGLGFSSGKELAELVTERKTQSFFSKFNPQNFTL